MPVTTPVDGSIVALPGAPLIQVPPVVASNNVVVNPSHTCGMPVIAAGNGFTVTVSTEKQPVEST
jgi:hypothetical protein